MRMHAKHAPGCAVQGIKSLPENDDYMSGRVPSQTLVARDHLLLPDKVEKDPVESDQRAEKDKRAGARARQIPEDDPDDDDPWRAVRMLVRTPRRM